MANNGGNGSGNSSAIGYNPEQVNQLMESIQSNVTDIEEAMQGDWTNLVTTLEQKWVGDDEQDFEDKLAQKICGLYEAACNLATGLIETIKNTSDSWHDFQTQNTVDGQAAPAIVSYSLEVPTIEINNPIVEKNEVSIDNSQNLGLMDGEASSIKSAVEQYVSNVQDKVNNLFSTIDSSNAFLGTQQSSSINNYMEETGQAMADVLTAVNDFYTALDYQAGTNYSGSEETVSTTLDSENPVDDTASVLGESKWNS